ncbi:MAG TPA: hypothetical protein VMW78_00165 [Anaerolineae bacterium]|nr:hypothetical protein [Anaerolineae bacterium]
MKKFIPLIIIFFIIWPAVCFSSYLIELKNGSTFITNHYWKEGRQIKFYYRGGIVGIEKNFVRTIKKTDIEYEEEIDSEKNITDMESKTNGKTGIVTREEKIKPETLDVKYYIKRKIELVAKLDESLEKIREATHNKDQEAKKKARDEMRKISAKIYDITDKVKEINNGKLPEGWWVKK